jgi:inner membrane protein
MMRVSHLTLGAPSAYALVAGAPLDQVALTVGAALLGSELPDWDLKLGIPHRGVTHWAIWPALIWFLFPFPIAHGLAIGWAVHILADCLTVNGLRPLWPLPFVFRGFVRTGGVWEFATVIPVIVLLVKFGI